MMPVPRQGIVVPENPTVAQIAEALSECYHPEGVVRWLAADQHRSLIGTVEGRRTLYAKVLALMEGAFS
jgi:hypothetical protein